MKVKSSITSRLPNFYNLSIFERLDVLKKNGWLSSDDISALKNQKSLSLELANHMIENVVGVYNLPLGIASNFIVNGQEILVPMVIEEPSVVAGASNMAKLTRTSGGFSASVSSSEMIGQIQILDINDLLMAKKRIIEEKSHLLSLAKEADPLLIQIGGGPRDLEVRIIKNSPIGPFLVLHLYYDVKDAMGANAVNTAVEKISPTVESITGGRVNIKILSNLADRRIASASCLIPLGELGFGKYDPEKVRDGIIAAWAFAAVDPYRAATHNKGILNGVDAVVIATGNDWRAVEAGAHVYAARNGHYTSLSKWEKDDRGNLIGKLELPLALGVIGGATKVHPIAQICLRIMNATSASRLAEIVASVGLAQNLAALRALATEGIQRGHMSLHARQIAITAGASGDQIEKLVKQLMDDKIIRIDHAQEILKKWNKHSF